MELKDADKIEKRCKRYDVPGHGHELTFSCYRRIPLLKNTTFCGYDRNIFTHAAAIHSVRYIHANPVKRGLVQWPQEWYYSSYRQMHSQGDGPLDINLNHFPRR
ncbi:MAG: hypothetical protein GXY41_06725 [Phycisphaerae bacterium]|nr:hypothetical protein [Phycisphaerae bacterium]